MQLLCVNTEGMAGGASVYHWSSLSLLKYNLGSCQRLDNLILSC